MIAVRRQPSSFAFVWHQEGTEPSVVHQVIPGGGVDAAGVRPGDVVVSEDGTPFPPERLLRVGQVVTLGIERDGRLLELDVSLVPMVQLRSAQMVAAVVVSLFIWAGSVFLLVRRFLRAEVRLLLLLAQTVAILALYPPVELMAWCRGLLWLYVYLSGSCVFLFPALLLHFHMTFPLVLSSRRQRQLALVCIYGAALVAAALCAAGETGWLPYGDLGWRILGLLLVFELLAAVALLVYVYLRRATAAGRRRLRLIVFSSSLAAGAFALLLALSAILTATSWTPSWMSMLFLLPAPLGYFYATARHKLFGIDRLLNRTLVYGLLSLGILFLYLGPLLLLHRLAPGKPLPEALVLAALTLLVGLSFSRTRPRVQKQVDRLFYGGWYDYPAVVETVCDALARSLAREQLEDVLTRSDNLIFNVDDGGDVSFGGAGLVAFPRPAYDSGWVSISQGGTAERIHSLGGDVDKYVVDLQCKSGGRDIHNLGVSDYSGGATWDELTTSHIEIHRGSSDMVCSQIRVRIWVYP